MKSGRPNAIVDAYRNRRTLEEQANQIPQFEGGASYKPTYMCRTRLEKSRCAVFIAVACHFFRVYDNHVWFDIRYLSVHGLVLFKLP